MNLKPQHYRLLLDAEHSSINEVNSDLRTNFGTRFEVEKLEAAGLLYGSWFGSIESGPMLKYELTSEGEKVVKDYKQAQLIASTSKCPNGTCKGAYATECYLKTMCITCGRDIIREK